jgi:hypothetical protein
VRLIVLTDIDDTLMQTSRKCVDAAAHTLSVGASNTAGGPSSFMTAKQRKLWSVLESQADVLVPVTARSAQTLSRVNLDFPSCAVTDFGATLLDGAGRLNSVWQELMLAQSAQLKQLEVFSFLRGRVPLGRELLSHEWRVANGVHVFVSFRTQPGQAHLELSAEVEAGLSAAGQQKAFYLHKTDRDVTVLPRFISKASAVRYLVEQQGWGSELVLALGDSLSDLGFMTQADYMVAPAASRLARCLKTAVAAEGLDA